MAVADVDDLRTPLAAQRDARRVVIIRHGVQELDALARGLERHQSLLERGRDQPVGVHGDMHNVGLTGAEDAKRAHVRGRLGHYHVARIDEDVGDDVETLLGARGDHHVVGVRVDALERHDLRDLLAQVLVALAGAVLRAPPRRAPPRCAASSRRCPQAEGRRCTACRPRATPPLGGSRRRRELGSPTRACGVRARRRRRTRGRGECPRQSGARLACSHSWAQFAMPRTDQVATDWHLCRRLTRR